MDIPLSASDVKQLGNSPVQQQSNENASTPCRNQLNNITTVAWSEEQIFAKSPPEPHNPRGWLVDLINRLV